jgi:RND family efflux transporter MFP subunit
LEERLARTVVRAPFAGVLDERHVDVGAMVSPGDAIARLVDLNPIKVAAGVPERYARNVSVGDEAMVEFEVLDTQPYAARIRYVGSTVDPQNRTFRIEVELANPGRLIKPQMVANMAVTRRAVSDAIVVPQDVLVRVESGYVVFVVAERGGVRVAEARPVTLGPARRNLVVIEDGVRAGEQLIVVGHRSVADGDRVNVVQRGA